MLIKELINKNGNTVDYCLVNGFQVKIRKAKIEVIYDGKHIKIIPYDKLGRDTGNSFSISLKRYGEKQYYEYSNWWDRTKVRVYFSKDDAYNYAIQKLRTQRQEINKKMLKLQIEWQNNNER